MSYSYDRGITAAQLTATKAAAALILGGTRQVAAERSALVLSGINDGLDVVFTRIKSQADSLTFGDLDPLFLSLDVFELAS